MNMIVGIFSSTEEKVISKFREKGLEVITIIRSDDNCEEIKRLNPDVLICRNRDNIEQFVHDCSNLKFVFIVEVGLEKLPFQELIKHSVRVANTSGISANIMSNYTLACILHHAANLEEDIANKQNHYWKKYQCTDSLSDKTLLVVGAGRTGTEIARKAKAFGMRTFGIVNHKRAVDYIDEVGTVEDLNQYLEISDYVVCTIPLTPQTRYLFNKDRFRSMKRDAVFINISRGAIVNEEDLSYAVDKGLFAKAYLDVFETEPLPANHAFWVHPNIIVTPHQSGRLENHLEKAIDLFFPNYAAFQNGAMMPNEVNLKQGY